MNYYTLQTDTALSPSELAQLQALGITRDLTSAVRVNTVRDQVLTLLRETLDTLKPVNVNRELNPNHALSHIYATYIAEPTETGVAKSKVWLQRIFEFERDIETNATVTQSDKDYYDLVKKSYPVNLNQIIEAPIAPNQVEIERTPSISFGCGQFGPTATDLVPLVGYESERIIILVSGIVKDKSENGTYPSYYVFTQACNLHATIDNLVKTIQAPPSVNGQTIGEIKAKVESRPLLYRTDDGVSSGEMIGFTITIDYNYTEGA